MPRELKKPNEKPSGAERRALRDKLIAAGFSTGAAAAIANANTRANQAQKAAEICKGLPKSL